MSVGAPDWTRVAIEAVTVVAIVAVIVVVATRLRRPWRRAAYALAVVLVLRYLALGNPLAWSFYAQSLRPEEIGWRQHGVIQKRRDDYLQVAAPPRYLAVGSSQTDAVYGLYRERHADFAIYGLAAMAPLDFVLFQNQIEHYHPRHVLLYLSEFDIARPQAPESLAMAPRQGLYLIRLWRKVRSLSAGEYGQALVDLGIGELFPEYKYGFVFRGLSDETLRRLSRPLGRAERRPLTRDSLQQRIGWLRESFDERYVEFNLAFLREYLERASSNGTRVVIVEGQYNPLVSTTETLRLRRIVRQRLEALSAVFDNVRFIPAEAVHEFSEDEYVDLTHVEPNAGYRFAERLVSFLSDGPL